MKSRSFSPALFFSLGVLLATRGALAGDFVTPADCNGWFETWAKATKASLAGELKTARELTLDKRTDAEAGASVDAVVALAKPLCARFEGHKVKPLAPASGTPASQICEDAFSKWEDERDTAYTMAVFEKKLPENSAEEKALVPAQDIARREANFGKGLCKMMARLH